MAENFNLIFGQGASQQVAWSDSDYQNGWQTVGDTPPTAEQFDALQRRSDLKAQELKITLDSVIQQTSEHSRQPSQAYGEGVIISASGLPATYYLRSTNSGITSASALVIPADVEEGDTITDGTIIWEVIRLALNEDLDATNVALSNTDLALAESTGYGIVSGCEPSINGLTVTVGAGIVHLADGTRKEIEQTNITLDAADSTNPRIDLVYIDSTGTVAKITGTAAASPSVPSVPTGGISICNVSVAAGATTGTVTDSRAMLATIVGVNDNLQNFNWNKGNGILKGLEPAINTSTQILITKGVALLPNGNTKSIERKFLTVPTNTVWMLAYIDRDGNIVTSTTLTAYPDDSVPLFHIKGDGTHGWQMLDDRMILQTNGISPQSITLSGGINGGDTVNLDNNFRRNYGFYYARCGVNTNASGVSNILTFHNAALATHQKLYIDILFTDYKNGNASLNNLASDIEYVSQIANELKGYGYVYNVLNEPSVRVPSWNNVGPSAEVYSAYVKEIYKTIKSIDSTAKVGAFNCVSSEEYAVSKGKVLGLTFVEDCFANYDIGKYMDFIAVHIYGEENALINKVRMFRWLIQKYVSKDIPIWISEFGWSSWAEGPSEEERGKYYPRYFLTAKWMGVENLFIYTRATARNDASDKEQWYGIFINGQTERLPIAQSIYSFTQETFMQQFYGRIQTERTSDYCMRVGNKYVYWTTAENHNVKLPDGEVVLFTDTVSYHSISSPVEEIYVEPLAPINSFPKTMGTNVFSSSQSSALDSFNIVGGYDNIAGRNSLTVGEKNVSGTLARDVIVGGTINYINAPGGFGMGMWNVNTQGRSIVAPITNGVVNITGLTLSAGWKAGAAVIVGGYTSKPAGQLTITAKSSTSITLSDTTITVGSAVITLMSYAYDGCNACIGGSNVASGKYSTAFGYGTVANERNLTAVGLFNLPASDHEPNVRDNLFVVGNGTSPLRAERSNALRVNASGSTYGAAAFNSTGADYAEYFEWADGNSEQEDRVGYFVTTDGNKIRKANSDDAYILGVVSGAPAIIGNSYNDQWAKKYIIDDFGRIEYMKENGGLLPKLNPNFDADKQFIKRENRAEWATVGMIGVLPVRDDGTCEINGYCKVANSGIATKATSGYRVIERVSENVVKIVFR